MSIEKVERTRKRAAYRVRWRDEIGRKHSKSFDRRADAEAFEAKIKLAKRRGELDDLDAGKQRLEDFTAEWWRHYAEPRLAAHTLKHYASLRDRYLVPRLGQCELRRLKPDVIQRFQATLAAQGVGQETIRKTLVLLQGILERAVEWGRIQINPVRVIRKPPG